MRILSRFPKSQPAFANRRRTSTQWRFQWRYTLYLLGAVACASTLSGGVAFYFLNQNYELFQNIAVIYAPQLLQNLEYEKLWLSRFLVISAVSMLVFYYFLGIRMMSRIVGPLQILQNHIRRLTRGNYRQPTIRIRNDDEFQDLIDTYNYFYLSLQAQTTQDLQRLRLMAMDKNSPDTYHLWEQMVDDKKLQLNGSPGGTAGDLDSRHVS